MGVRLMRHSTGYTLGTMKPGMIHTGLFPQTLLDEFGGLVKQLVDDDDRLQSLQRVAQNGKQLYLKTRPAPSKEGAYLAKRIQKNDTIVNIHPLICGEDPEKCDLDFVEK